MLMNRNAKRLGKRALSLLLSLLMLTSCMGVTVFAYEIDDETMQSDSMEGDVFYCPDCDAEVVGEREIENEIIASCTEDGSYDEVFYCPYCWGELSRETIIDYASGHAEGEPVIENEIAATCTEAGSHDTVVYCAVCGEELSRESVTDDASGHAEGELMIENEVAATCTEAGSHDEVVYCAVCGEELSRESVTEDASGHVEGEPVIENEIAATCTEAGSHDEVVYCAVCGEELSREPVTDDASGHVEAEPSTENEVAATCTEAGSHDTVINCAVCGEELSRESVTDDAVGHVEAEPVIENEVTATCTEAGSHDTVINCAVCGEELSRENNVDTAFGHHWDEGTMTAAPTAETEGKMTYTCLNCPETKTEVIEKLLTAPETASEDVPKDENEIIDDEPEEEHEPEVSYPAFEQSKKVNGVVVTVKAEEGVFPDGAELSVEEVPVYQEAEADAAVEEVRDENQKVAVSYIFDIKVVDPVTREEIQPTDGQKVSVSFAMAEVADENLETSVYHIAEDEDTGTLVAESLEVTQEVTEETGEETTAVVETESFSLYKVEFTYDNFEYVMQGNTTVALDEILSELGLTGPAENAVSSNETLFKAYNENGIWYVQALRAFATTETLTVTINNVSYEIAVTDDYVVDSGRCGDNLSWSLNSEGTLTITGTGNMYNYGNTTDNFSPWYNKQSSIKTVSILAGTTGIGEYAFNGCSNLKTITIPDSIFDFGSIDMYSFYQCSSITDVYYGGSRPDWNNTLQKTGNDCLTSATIHYQKNGVDGVWGELTWSLDNNGKLSITGSGPMDDYTYDTADSGSAWERYAFSIESIEIESGITSIGNFAFYLCYYLTSVAIPDSIISIGEYAFSNCTSLTNVIIPEGITSIGNGAFSSCSHLTNVIIPEGITSISNNAFTQCTNLTNVTIPEGTTRIGNNAFSQCWNLTSVTIPDSVASIDEKAFYDCRKMRNIIFLGGPPSIKNDSFSSVTANASYYPDKGWTEDKLQNYGGTLTWFPLNSLWKWLQSEFSQGGEVTLPLDITAESDDIALEIPYGKTVTLDLNGYTLDRGLSSGTAVSGGNVITVNGTLTVTDSSTNKTGTITGGNTAEAGGGIVIEQFGTFTLSGGAISGNKAYQGGGVLNDGKKFTMIDGEISNNTSTNIGGGVFNNSTTEISGGVICNNSADTGGGVYSQSGPLSISGGKITGNNALSGGGVSAYSGFTMTDGEISGNTANYGGGVHAGGLSMTGGRICGNIANKSGGGVCCFGILKMSGGVISDNSANENGGGVESDKKDHTIHLSGTAKITGNRKGNTNSVIDSNVYLLNGQTIKIEGVLEETVKIGITTEISPTVESPIVITSGLSNKGTEDNFSSDSAGYNVSLNTDGEAVLGASSYNITTTACDHGTIAAKVGGTAVTSAASGATVALTVTPDEGYVLHELTVTDSNGDPVTVTNNTFIMPASNVTVDAVFKTPWQSLQAKLDGTDETIILTGDVVAGTNDTTPLEVKSGRTVILDLNGHVINRALGSQTNNGNVITVLGSLTVKDGNEDAPHSPAFTYTDRATEQTAEIYGGIITGGNNSGNGGGIYIGGTGSFILSGGSIAGNTAQFGGGIYTVGIDGLTMSGGTVLNNLATSNGGGIYSKDSGLAILAGTITNNTAANAGGGLFCNGRYSKSISGGTISYNKAEQGGGVGLAGNAAVHMSGNAVIAYNSAGDGGGVNLYYGNRFDMTGGKIENNTSTGNGGGISMSYSDTGREDRNTFTMSGGSIAYNSAAGDGGGIYVPEKKCTLTVTGGSITNNSAEGNGGGAYLGGQSIASVSGNVIIFDNEKETDTTSTTNNVYIDGTNKITIASPGLGENANIGVTTRVTPDLNTAVVFTSGLSGKGSAANFTSDNRQYKVKANEDSGEAELYVPPFYTVTISNEITNGTVSFSNTEEKIANFAAGDTVELTVVGEEHYVPDSLTVTYNGGEGIETITPVQDSADKTKYTFEMPAANAAVTGSFITEWADLQNKINNAASATVETEKTVVLDRNYTALSSEDALVIPNGDVTIDLNGFVINRNMTELKANGNVITVNGELTITDGDPTRSHDPAVTYTDPFTNQLVETVGGIITGGKNTGDGGGIYVNRNARLTLAGGNIIANSTKDAGGGIYCGDLSSFIMTSGSIAGNSAVRIGGGAAVVGGWINLSGGAIKNNTAKNGGGIELYYPHRFTASENGDITGSVSISENKATDTGGGVYYIAEFGRLIMDGGSISGNNAANGGGIAIASDGIDFWMKGGIIQQNTANSCGGGIYSDDSNTIELSSGSITGNTANDGGGISVKGNCMLKITGSPTVSGNLKGSGNEAKNNNVSLEIGKTINVSGTLTNAHIGVTTLTLPQKDSPVIITTGLKGNALSNFFSDLGYDISTNTNGEAILISEDDTASTPWKKLQGRISNAFDGEEILLTEVTEGFETDDVVADPGDLPLFVQAGKNVTIDLCGHSINRNLKNAVENGYVIKVLGSLTITDSGNSGTITGGNNTDNGGGIYVNGGTFTLNKGSITNNIAYGRAASGKGGGVYVDSGGTFNLVNGSVMENQARYGGGIYFKSTGVFTMSGGEISNNQAQSFGLGGGIYIDRGTATISDGSIVGNIANSRGGGVYIEGSAKFTMTGGRVSGNSAKNNGGGIDIDSRWADFQISGSPIIISNIKTETNTQNNVYLLNDHAYFYPHYQRVQVTGELTEDAKIGVTTGATPDLNTAVVFTSGLSGKGSAASFISDDTSYIVRTNDAGEAILVIPLTVTIADITNGKVSADPSKVLAGETVTLTVEPDSGYALDTLTVIDEENNPVTVTNNQFVMPETNVTVTAAFKQHVHSMTYSANGKTITATCSGDGNCGLTDNKVTLTIAAPEHETYGDGKSEQATLSDPNVFNAATGMTVLESSIHYKGTEDTAYDSNTAPADAGTYTASITLSDVKTGETTMGSVTASVDYSIGAAMPTVTTIPKPAAITYGQTLSDSTLTGGEAKFGDTAVAGSFAWTDGSVKPSVSDSEKTEYEITFTPEDTVNYSSVVANVKVTVLKAEPTIAAAPAAGAITYGQTLADSTLTGGEAKLSDTAVAGSFAWTDGSVKPSVSDSEKTEYEVTFTPEDTVNYNSAVTKVKVTVKKAEPTIAAAPAAGTIAYGQTLSYSTLTGGEAKLGDTAVAGSFAWTDGSVKPAVSDSEKTEYEVTFTPEDTVNFSNVVTKVKVTVKKAEPTIVAGPAAGTITYGQTLADSTLTGGEAKFGDTAVAGSFAWTDGSVKPSVSDSEKTQYAVEFTPTDTVNYNKVSARVALKVSKAEASYGAAPKAKAELVYTGAAQALVDAGTAEGGTMLYAVTANDTKPTEGFSAAIPTGTIAGTSYVWYKVAGDENHADSGVFGPVIVVIRYKVEYNANGGTGAPAAQFKHAGSTLTLSGGRPTRGGYEFLGWGTSAATAEAQYQPGSQYTADANATLYAVWKSSLSIDEADVPASHIAYADGVKVSVNPDGTLNLPEGSKVKVIETYEYAGGDDPHSRYPTDLKVWIVKENADGSRTAERISELDNILNYAGCSIRITGKRGIRMITAVPTDKKTALIAGNLAGYTLEEYGTVVGWSDALSDNDLTMENATGGAYAYKKDVADPVFKTSGGMMQYTNVLVGFTDEMVGRDLVMRSYMILSKDGDSIVIFGGTVQRSIGYIAYQNRNAYASGSDAYKYIWNLIHIAYGNAFDAEYKE